MNRLPENWLTDKLIDFEYKKYVLLAYLQDVSKNFDQTFLYPSLADLVEHYRTLVKFRESKQNMYDQFPERVAGADLEKFQLVFAKFIEDDSLMQEIENIVDFSIPEFEKQLQEGRKIYEFIEEKISIHPVGVLPIRTTEGYIFLKNGGSRETRIFEYQVSFYESANDRYRSILTQHLNTVELSLSTTYESVKNDLLKSNKKLPNPAAYAIESELEFPVSEALIPVAKRSFVKYLALTSAA